MNTALPSSALLADMQRKRIDIERSLAIAEAFNQGRYHRAGQSLVSGVPALDGEEVIDLRSGRSPAHVFYSCSQDEAISRLESFGIQLPESVTIRISGQGRRIADFTADSLLSIGMSLLSRSAYGILNGGSATSYADLKKNHLYGDAVFDELNSLFAATAPLCVDKPKGITPAYINPDGSPGASFLELKMRARLLLYSRMKRRGVNKRGKILPLFQMTSDATAAQLDEYYEEVAENEFLGPLSRDLGIKAADWIGEVQPLIAAFSHSAEGPLKRIFDHAYGKTDSALALPGGHGQCFAVLAPTFRALHAQGIRYACLGNVDNIGYTPDPMELAILALSGRPAAFDFSTRTPMDIKGGILVKKENGAMTVADIGPAITFDEVLAHEHSGATILFNCASGIFDLDFLVPRLESLADTLPVRFSDQDKDAGKYSQAEQITWEVTELLPSFLAFAVTKRDRFIAAKLLVDTLLTSGVGYRIDAVPENLRLVAMDMKQGLHAHLERTFGLLLRGGRWVPGEGA